MEIDQLYQLYKKHFKVATDTRKDLNNAMFFALRGDNFNGNQYASNALEKGASYAIIDDENFYLDERTILVDNVLTCLQNLANYHRKQLGIPVIALTGSNGKTTTKELIYTVLKEKFLTAATKGNLNNHIGVPLTLLELTPDIEMAVVEMGANHPKEIEELCNIANPDYGYITNFGKVHLEGFGSLEGVIESKTEMYRYIQKNNKQLFVNDLDEVQLKRSEGITRKTFPSEKSDCSVELIDANPFVKVAYNSQIIQSQLIGRYNFTNIAAAIAIGQFFNVEPVSIKKAIESYLPTNNRSQIITKGSVKIILDAYNANPNSMAVAIENLAQLTDEKKVAILGDMFEIGQTSIEEHQHIAQQAVNSNLDEIILVGSEFCKAALPHEKIKTYESFKAFQSQFDKTRFENATVLIKASRGMALERIVDLL